MKIKRPVLLSIFFLSLAFTAPKNQLSSSTVISNPHNSPEGMKVTPEFLSVDDKWVELVFNSLTEDERIGQLFMIAAYSNKGQRHINKISELISKYNIGGVIYFQGGPYRQAIYTNQLQKVAKVPLLVGIDAEWGLAMRLDSTFEFSKQIALGAIQDHQLIYELGEEIGRQCKRLGIHINFAPVVDINNNPDNPVINDRSFGEDRENVAQKGIAYMRGLQGAGVLACAKHFPGHGDTDSDSHLTLPKISHPRQRLDSIELYPFRKIINAGVGGMMNAHIEVPSIDFSSNKAASLSRNVVQDLLTDELGFQGLKFTDALNMKGVTDHHTVGDLEVKALLAGNDVLLYSEDIPTAVQAIKNALDNGILSKESINHSVKKILRLKYWAGLSKNTAINTDNLYEELTTSKTHVLNRKLIESALTLARNEKRLVPFKNIFDHTFASISIGSEGKSIFQETLDKYADFDHFDLFKNADENSYNTLLDKVKKHSVVVISLHKMSRYAVRDYGITLNTLGFIKKLQSYTNVVLVVFGNPYSLKYFDDVPTVLMAYNDDDVSQSYSAQLLFNGISAKGKLPVTASPKYKYGQGLLTDLPGRFKYTIPEEVGLNAFILSKIDDIAKETIDEKIAPGCQILVARNGSVIYEKSFGYHTYQKKTPVENAHLFDLASITKIAATNISFMKLLDQGLVSLDSTLSTYLPEVRNTNKGNLIIRNILLHQAGLKDWIPFYYSIKDDDIFICTEESDPFCIPVANDIFMANDYVDSVWAKINNSPINYDRDYKYSDLGFYYLKEVIERITGTGLDLFTETTFYFPLGLRTMGYNPLYKFDLNEIAPTEQDNIFRHQVVHGYVHDQGAAMLGGVAGHAGLFSNASDLAIIAQMLLNGGSYGERQFLKKETIELFTNKQNKSNRRGLGFDKPELDINKISPTCDYASPKTFGHTGFTGTCFWVDPEYDLVYVFLSNRVYPSSSPNLLAKKNIRTRIQQTIYDAMEDVGGIKIR